MCCFHEDFLCKQSRSNYSNGMSSLHTPPAFRKDNTVFCINESRIISKRWKYDLLPRKRVIVFHGQIDNTKLKRDSSSFAKSHCLFMPYGMTFKEFYLKTRKSCLWKKAFLFRKIPLTSWKAKMEAFFIGFFCHSRRLKIIVQRLPIILVKCGLVKRQYFITEKLAWFYFQPNYKKWHIAVFLHLSVTLLTFSNSHRRLCIRHAFFWVITFILGT